MIREEVTRLFFDLEHLEEIPAQIRRRLNGLTSDYARDQFLEEFRAKDGRLEEIAGPQRIS